MINEIRDENNIKQCTQVIRKAFKTVADEFGLTEHNAPTNPAFITYDRLGQSLMRGTKLFVMKKAQKIIGCVAVEQSPKDDNVFFIERLAVLPAERHRGYGTALMDFACAYIRRMSGKIVSIGIIDENHVLKNWYCAYGFKETAKKKLDHLPFTICFLAKHIL
jgi:ribosomal protein S18 acetylase RimI-like enzyme